jgi:1-deoxy-D-xylulose-5-phosphate reductoisomerase
MSQPTMLVPIQYALTYPERKPGLIPPYDFTKNNTIQFYQPDLIKFRCLALAFESIRRGQSLPCFMNAANEVLVSRFLEGQISWDQIGGKLEKLLERHHLVSADSLEEILSVDEEARRLAAE